MKLIYFILILCCLVPATAILSFVGYVNYKIDYVRTIEAHIMVGNVYGVNIDSSDLYLGATKPGGIAFRNFTVTNTGEETRKIEVSVKGPMKDWATITPNYFLIDPGEKKHVKYRIKVPLGTSHGNYTSKVMILFIKP